MDRRVSALETELARVRRAFEDALAAVAPERLHMAPPGHWSPAQLVWHCAKSERAVARLLERLDLELPEMVTIPPGPAPDRVLHLLDHIPYHDRTIKKAAPAPLHPPPTIDLPGERLRLREGRAQLIAAIRSAGPRLTLLRFDHLLFGPLDGWQWVLSVAKHEERHIDQLREVASAPL